MFLRASCSFNQAFRMMKCERAMSLITARLFVLFCSLFSFFFFNLNLWLLWFIYIPWYFFLWSQQAPVAVTATDSPLSCRVPDWPPETSVKGTVPYLKVTKYLTCYLKKIQSSQKVKVLQEIVISIFGVWPLCFYNNLCFKIFLHNCDG